MREPGTPDGALLCNFSAKKLKTESAIFRRLLKRLTMKFHRQRFHKLDVRDARRRAIRRRKGGGFLRPNTRQT